MIEFEYKMSSEEIKLKRSKSRKRNFIDKLTYDYTEHKGAFAIKTLDPRKEQYKRVKKVYTNEYYEEED